MLGRRIVSILPSDRVKNPAKKEIDCELTLEVEQDLKVSIRLIWEETGATSTQTWTVPLEHPIVCESDFAPHMAQLLKLIESLDPMKMSRELQLPGQQQVDRLREGLFGIKRAVREQLPAARSVANTAAAAK